MALMIILVVIVLGATAISVRAFNAQAMKADRYRVTQDALEQAKAGLIAYAVADPNRPGSLPCPDADNDGQSLVGTDYVGSACVTLVGRLPWITLRLPDLRDASGEPLWYAVSSDFQANNTTVPLNSDTAYLAGNTSLTITGNQAASNLPAIVIAPGPTLRRADGVAQSRACPGAGCSTASNFLDVFGADNATGATTRTFISADESNTFNDRLLPVYSDDIMSLVERRVGRELAQNLRSHFDNWSSPPAVADTTFSNFKGFYPWPATFNDPSNVAAGVTNTSGGLLPFDASTVVWTSASTSLGSGCTGINTTQITCTGMVVCVNFPPFIVLPCLLNITGRVSNVSTAFLVPPEETSVTVSGPNIGTLTKVWTLNKGTAGSQSSQNLDFSLSSGSFLPGINLFINALMTVTIQAPRTSTWASSGWLATNRWYRVSYYALSPDYALPGTNPGTCSTCISISNTNPASNNVQSIVITTGRALSTQAARPVTTPAALTNFLENGNQVTTDLAFEKNLRTSTFNDQPVAVRP
jgi:hypothetical protein